ncbi:MAG: rhomboid family intramembrane serine protease [Gemmatimonadetes bacterium]|nr:rhomboid family intramembrane serine protease [Gemmatimonadota bacterium]HPF61248.1 rhomboid family intramembrane serine protease [Gemmatimonadales bacterium]HRX18842.1 rhomboid family intramembrane serine protease [Gemmatimonadales bacterium]
MFPYRDENPAILPPYVTVAMIALNVAAWILIQGMGSALPLARSVCELGLTPGDLLGRLPTGSSFPVGGGLACVVEAGIPWRTPLTSMFLHGGWLHLLGNMWFLWVFGNNVEDAMGHGRFLLFYLLCGLGAAAAQVMVDPASAVPMVGASGAISGVMGAYGVLYPRVRIHCLVVLVILFFRVTLPAWVLLGYWLLLQLAGTSVDQVGGVAFAAHLGGFAAGMGLILLFRNPALLARRRELLAARAWAAPEGGVVP